MHKAKVAVLISGGGTNMAALLYASRAPECPFEIVLVASNNPEAGGLKLAAAEGVPTFALPHKGMARADHDMAMDAAIRASGAEYVALAGYMRILTAEFVSGWAGRMLNIHPSLLPKYKGLHTHERAIEAGDSHGGVTVHLVTPELDDGPILGQTPVAIIPGDTAESLAGRVLFAEHQLYARCLTELVTRPYRADWLLARVSELAAALPEVEARESHGSPAWSIKGGKFFAYFNDRHHGEQHIALLVKTSGQDEMNALIDADPEVWFRPAYYGASGWAGLILNRADVDWDQVSDWLARSWRSVAPKRLTRLMDVADQF
ncbi:MULTISPECIES: phosphoribosylglycinamide formyltransferase [unclassified Novosphingobium]|uniref:phosphoribosylglycinamide formyltransferase n=1 Tax=unclassified Novosphingobium TaxID=2644732 RepID=UPI000868E433|nr:MULTISPECIES: phosphoribosylglycinamide formyltransferase [unclassified Novosphingobium]MBN9144214.1 phosphoribosylglycinamide formyltransferase [Novosphingobium sp.]MDR6708453.1 phosphoribosylglycinamide formyltransferase-1 [Novosphingobium sp. 1748]ODU81166.1 MAG: phosphoribosylglycinamide formyltransferase [Novosphingobium sp. SCN 63-17]OJX94976.1 MAG: phosphoribosylglycinamide formyltransferase [Novosphingobium sp. 63-713]